jgi:hypothetical protein
VTHRAVTPTRRPAGPRTDTTTAGTATTKPATTTAKLANEAEANEAEADDAAGGDAAGEETGTVYGDNAYGTGASQDRLQNAGIDSRCKTQRPTAPGGLFGKDSFEVDLEQDTVTCPAGQSTPIRRGKDGGGTP